MDMGEGMTKTIARILVAAVAILSGPSSGLWAAESLPVIEEVVVGSWAHGPEVRLQASELLETVHYSPQPGVWVVEMPEATWDVDVSGLASTVEGLAALSLEHVEEFGKRNSRLTVRLDRAADLDLAATASGTVLRFSAAGFEAVEDRAEAAVAAPDVDPEPAAPSPALATLPPVSAASTPETTVPAKAAASPARLELTSVEATRSGDGVVVTLHGTAPLRGRSFELEGPNRLVVDLEGVVNTSPRRRLAVDSPAVDAVRVAQFRGYPDPVTRLVVDLDHPVTYRLEATRNGAVLRVGATDAVSDADLAVLDSDDFDVAPSSTIQITRSEPMARPPSEADSIRTLQEFPSARTAGTAPDAVVERNPWVATPDQLLEEAVAVRETQYAGESFETQEVESDEIQFTGDPISLTLKDADIKDVLKTFSALTDLNIVIDPEVNGSVTVELRDVPWDQALDLILKINGLDWVLENNVMRISTIAKLSAERRALSQFQQSQEESEPLRTVIKPLSYAKASYVADLLGSDSFLLSPRGVVTVDERTNTLIIRDIVDRVEGVLKLIETLDAPTPQVVIEGRIVETTRDFSRQLGVAWGFTGTMDAAHGNDTGLSFPNSATITGDVGLPAAATNGVIGVSMGDILNTFNLDFVLTAAEKDGVAKIVSTPRVTTQNLKSARIRSGLQVPVQTVVDNTVRTIYIDATLTLEVTPQITAEGTVNLEVDLAKRNPIPAGQITGGENAPIQTRDVSTELLVRDGGTTVIGGIYVIDSQEAENSVPGLGKIPVLRHLFRNTDVSTTHDELLIFITPRIVKY
jgi:type IV pilus secretin PilQ/predicted competence protein